MKYKAFNLENAYFIGIFLVFSPCMRGWSLYGEGPDVEELSAKQVNEVERNQGFTNADLN